MQTKENSFINKFISSIKDFEKYPEMASKPFNIVISYLVKLMLLFTLIVTSISIYDVSKNINKGIEYFKNEIPNLEFVNNELNVDSQEEIIISPQSIFDLVILDTNDITQEQIQDYIKEAKSHTTSAILLKDKIIINTGAQTIQYEYKNIASMYNIGNITKEDIINNFIGKNLVMLYIAIFIISFIWLFIAYLISIIFDSIIFGIIGYMTALILRLRMKFVAMIKIAIHALTLPIILNLIYIIIQTIFNFEIKYFEVMYIAVTYIYVITAILMVKSDLIRRGQQLTKIIEEEKRVKEQLQRQKEEQEEKEKEEKQEKRKDKEKQEDEKTQEDNLGTQPQGENA